MREFLVFFLFQKFWGQRKSPDFLGMFPKRVVGEGVKRRSLYSLYTHYNFSQVFQKLFGLFLSCRLEQIRGPGTSLDFKLAVNEIFLKTSNLWFMSLMTLSIYFWKFESLSIWMPSMRACLTDSGKSCLGPNFILIWLLLKLIIWVLIWFNFRLELSY